jgi:uncharacterized membrane protein YfcA
MTATLLLLAIGAGAGFLSGIFGIGGGIIIVPALIFLGRYSPQEAAGTSLGAMMLPLGAAIGALTYYKAGHLAWRNALLIAGGMFVGAWLGSRLATNVEGPLLRKGFALLLVFMAWKMWKG